jgi:hypothetical protein
LWRKALRPLTHGTHHGTPRHPELILFSISRVPGENPAKCDLHQQHKEFDPTKKNTSLPTP